jgi:hypothetical protein
MNKSHRDDGNDEAPWGTIKVGMKEASVCEL